MRISDISSTSDKASFEIPGFVRGRYGVKMSISIYILADPYKLRCHKDEKRMSK